MDFRHRLELLALASLTEEDCPAPELLADYLLDRLPSTAQLQIAAHVRTCPLCQEAVALARPPQPRPRMFIARLLPTFATGVRSGAESSANVIRQYRAADIIVDLTIVPQTGGFWRITGQLLRGQQGVDDQEVRLRPRGRRPYIQRSDSQGFFTFEDIPPGRYTLTVTNEHAHVQIRGIELTEDAQ